MPQLRHASPSPPGFVEPEERSHEPEAGDHGRKRSRSSLAKTFGVEHVNGSAGCRGLKSWNTQILPRARLLSELSRYERKPARSLQRGAKSLRIEEKRWSTFAEAMARRENETRMLQSISPRRVLWVFREPVVGCRAGGVRARRTKARAESTVVRVSSRWRQ